MAAKADTVSKGHGFESSVRPEGAPDGTSALTTLFPTAGTAFYLTSNELRTSATVVGAFREKRVVRVHVLSSPRSLRRTAGLKRQVPKLSEPYEFG